VNKRKEIECIVRLCGMYLCAFAEYSDRTQYQVDLCMELHCVYLQKLRTCVVKFSTYCIENSWDESVLILIMHNA
jgi:hypothetical protein